MENNEVFNRQNNPLKYSSGISAYDKPNYYTPQVDILEDEDKVCYIYELPGLAPETLNVELSDESIFIQGEIAISTLAQEANLIYQERNKGAFFREMSLPLNIEQQGVEANFKRGLLEIYFQKSNNY